MILSNKRITKALIRLQDVQAGLHLCSQTSEDRFSRVEAHIKAVVDPVGVQGVHLTQMNPLKF